MIQHKIPVKKILAVLNICLLTAVLLHSILRDIQLEKHYCWDIRNRVVGARLQKDGKLPYFYHWTRADGFRYYDQFNITRKGASNITSSPFFHRLLYPACDLPQRTISVFWFWLQYILLASIILLMMSITTLPIQKLLVINAGVLITCTEAWKMLIATGQSYLITTVLISCLCFLLYRHNKKTPAVAALCAVTFILVRPIGIIFLLPFALQFKKYVRFLTIGFAGLGLYGIFALSNPFEKALWQNYACAIRTQAAYQLGTDSAQLIPANERIAVDQLEGVDFGEKEKRAGYYSMIVSHDELANVYALYELLLHKKMSLLLLNTLLSAILLTLTGIYYYHKNNLQPLQIIIFSFLLYMVVEIFSPVKRHQYYTLQWLPLLMAGFILIKDWKKPAFLLLIAGFILNMGYIYWIPRRHTLGEICWFAGMLLITFAPTNHQDRWKQSS